MEKAGIYIHIPFCQKKCGYCDFYSTSFLTLIPSFVNRLTNEIDIVATRYSDLQFNTIFFGGGTPSLLPTVQLEKILNSLCKSFSIDSNGEFTIEANPGTLTPKKIIDLHQMGFNRLSLGAQSFNMQDLQFLGRIHSVEEIYSNFEVARKAGFNNINIDLITAFPGLSQRNFLNTLKNAAALKPEHISCYTLIFEPKTPFYTRMQRNEIIPLSSDEEAEFCQITEEYLTNNGYSAYEISNYSRHRKYRCQHNLKYWHHSPYLGFGPSAHSFITPYRWFNTKSIHEYLYNLSQNILPISKREKLDRNQLEFEYIFLHMRLKEGIDLNDFSYHFNINFEDKYKDSLQKLIDAQLVKKLNKHIKLTAKGWLLADEIISTF